MNAKHFSAILHPNSPRYETWRRIFGGYHVPLKSPEPLTVPAWQPEVEGEQIQVYLLDPAALPLWIRARLIAHAAEEFGIPVFEISGMFARLGVPIPASDVMVSKQEKVWA